MPWAKFRTDPLATVAVHKEQTAHTLFWFYTLYSYDMIYKVKLHNMQATYCNRVDMMHVWLTELDAAKPAFPPNQTPPPSKAVLIPGQVVMIFSKCSTPKPALLLTYLLITMESSISHCFNITGWRKYAHQRLVIVLKLISDCLGLFVGHSGFVSENPNGNTDYDDDVT